MLNSLYDQVQEYGDPQQESISWRGRHMTYEKPFERAIVRYEEETGRQIGRPDFGRDLQDREVAADSGEQKAASSRDPMLEILARAGKQTLETMKAENRKG